MGITVSPHRPNCHIWAYAQLPKWGKCTNGANPVTVVYMQRAVFFDPDPDAFLTQLTHRDPRAAQRVETLLDELEASAGQVKEKSRCYTGQPPIWRIDIVGYLDTYTLLWRLDSDEEVTVLYLGNGMK